VIRVARINVAPVKGLGLAHPDEVELTERGVEANRRFFLRHDDRLYNGKDCGALVRIRPEAQNGRLSMTFPDGRELAAALDLGDAVVTDFWNHRDVHGRVVVGPWAEALSEYTGKDVQLVRVGDSDSAVDVHPGTVVSRASCERLGQELGADVDGRRFRMLLELDGAGAHEEDEWHGARIGDAVVRFVGPVARCAVTTQDPDTGVPTLDTLRGIRAYREQRDPRLIDFGVYFEVEQPGRVRVGDAVEPS
jgi:uncharacterized protein